MSVLVHRGNPVKFEVGSYTNNRLYVGLIDLMEVNYYADVTINLPAFSRENPYDVFLSNDIRDISEWLEEIGAGKATGEVVQNGMGTYAVFHFYPGKLMELDPDGFREFDWGSEL